ncbi:hypothetical protein Y032_0246g6 [Ancylostoma ceylanicum]|uniref:Dipeptidylpeptidase IV N-terminal domain-containing protein n=1 Tax=Ancylostoma ceylanicum TaxID=53326 RepID=A0A016SDQ7_9BILA|nr:hypothetical protein Y032_0246g6 [Ancylostoma ceylanicum]
MEGLLAPARYTRLSTKGIKVIELIGLCNYCYFTASAPSPTNRHLYVTKGSPTTSDAWSCLTCAFSNCTYQSNEVSPDFKHILTSCEGPAPEHYYLSRISQRKLENTVEILRNDKYDPAATMLPLVISETFPLKQGYEARVKILLPPGQQSRYGTRSLPVLVHV